MNLSIGTNLTAIRDWSPSLPFIDAFKSSRFWLKEIDYTAFTGTVDKNGWISSSIIPENKIINSVPSTVMFNATGNNYPGGRYVVLYEGTGEIVYKWAAKKNSTLSTPGRDVIDVNNKNDAGILLSITTNDPDNTGDYIRNIKILPETLESYYLENLEESVKSDSTAAIFNTAFLERIAPFQAVRFMDWMQTNHSILSDWNDRPTLTQARWSTASGVPVEIMVALANRGNFDPWFCLPHMATKEFIRNFADYVKKHLNPARKIYLEYSNETWNWIFGQTKWINDKAKEAGMYREHFYALKSSMAIDIFKGVFAGDSDRIVGVLAGQAGNTGVLRSAIQYLKKTDNLESIDAIAIAPYFGDYLGAPKYASQVENFTLDQLFQELMEGGLLKRPDGSPVVPGGALNQSYKWIAEHEKLATENNLELVAYEAGQHLVGYGGNENNQKITNLFIAANRDERMNDIYSTYISKWFELGGGLFMNFLEVSRPSKWGSWGVMENLADADNPKYRALLTALGEAK